MEVSQPTSAPPAQPLRAPIHSRHSPLLGMPSPPQQLKKSLHIFYYLLSIWLLTLQYGYLSPSELPFQ